MLWRIISLLFIPVFIWMLIGGYKEIKGNYNISENAYFLFSLFWLPLIAFATVNLFMYAVFNVSVAFALKYW